MSVFVDTGVFYAHHDDDASRNAPATDAMDEVIAGRFGTAFTSDYVFDESVTLTRSRSGQFAPARRIGDRIRGLGDYPDVFDLLRVDESTFEAAVDTFERYDDQPLSFTDATTVALVRRHDVDRVLSFDDDFDGIVDRLDPREA